MVQLFDVLEKQIFNLVFRERCYEVGYFFLLLEAGADSRDSLDVILEATM